VEPSTGSFSGLTMPLFECDSADPKVPACTSELVATDLRHRLPKFLADEPSDSNLR
jgi:hypothetical protein